VSDVQFPYKTLNFGDRIPCCVKCRYYRVVNMDKMPCKDCAGIVKSSRNYFQPLEDTYTEEGKDEESMSL